MALLKKKDPFLYYSIPGNRNAILPGEPVDLSELNLSSDSRSNSYIAIETAAGGSNDPHRSHSHTDVVKSATKRGGEASDLQHPAFTINESFTVDEESFKKKPTKSSPAHCRSKSLADAIIDKSSTSSHRRTVSAPVFESNIVTRKTAISFESYADEMLDDVIEELSKLQPRIQRDDSSGPNGDYDVRRGSLLQDLLFASIEQLRDEGVWDDSDDYTDE